MLTASQEDLGTSKEDDCNRLEDIKYTIVHNFHSFFLNKHSFVHFSKIVIYPRKQQTLKDSDLLSKSLSCLTTEDGYISYGKYVTVHTI